MRKQKEKQAIVSNMGMEADRERVCVCVQKGIYKKVAGMNGITAGML